MLIIGSIGHRGQRPDHSLLNRNRTQRLRLLRCMRSHHNGHGSMNLVHRQNARELRRLLVPTRSGRTVVPLIYIGSDRLLARAQVEVDQRGIKGRHGLARCLGLLDGTRRLLAPIRLGARGHGRCHGRHALNGHGLVGRCGRGTRGRFPAAQGGAAHGAVVSPIGNIAPACFTSHRSSPSLYPKTLSRL